MKYYIYLIVNQINGKVYVGQTNDFFRRKSEHLNKSKTFKTKLYNAIRKYGEENFEFFIMEEVTEETKDAKEMYYIKFFDTFKNGYNSTVGGEGNKKISDEKVQKIIEDYLTTGSANQTGNNLGVDRSTVLSYARLYNLKIEKKPGSNTKRPVVKLEPHTQEELQIYPSLADAAKDVEGRASNIVSVCRGKKITAYGYSWKYLNSEK